MMYNNSTIPSCNFGSDACLINQKSPIGKGEDPNANSEEELVSGQMDFDLYSSDNDEESSEMSLGVCGSLSSSEDDDSTSLFGMGTSHSESNKELHRLQGDVHGKARLLRYSALYLALSHVVTLGCEEVEDFALAHDAISNLVDILQRRRVEKDGNKVLPNNKCGVKDPTMAATKGAPKRGKANLCASEEEPKLKRRCTKCGVPGHTRRTCAGHDLKAVRVGSEAASSAFAESSFAHVKSTERSTSLRREVPFEEGPKVTSSRSQGGAPLGMTPTQSNVSRFAPSGGGGNIFLGGQRIDHFYATPTCGPTSSVPCYSPSFVPGVIHSGSHGASTSLGSEAIERWILEGLRWKRMVLFDEFIVGIYYKAKAFSCGIWWIL
ncbi:hypothetical protein S83_060044, partial [Arachis hypogaea]